MIFVPLRIVAPNAVRFRKRDTLSRGAAPCHLRRRFYLNGRETDEVIVGGVYILKGIIRINLQGEVIQTLLKRCVDREGKGFGLAGV